MSNLRNCNESDDFNRYSGITHLNVLPKIFRDETWIKGFLKIGAFREVDRHHRCGSARARVGPETGAGDFLRGGRTLPIHTFDRRTASPGAARTASNTANETGTTAFGNSGTAAGNDAWGDTTTRPGHNAAGHAIDPCDSAADFSRTQGRARKFAFE
jgi:hypothetical protein